MGFIFPQQDKPHDLSPTYATLSTYAGTGVLCLGAAFVELTFLSGESSHSLVATLIHHQCEEGRPLNRTLPFKLILSWLKDFFRCFLVYLAAPLFSFISSLVLGGGTQLIFLLYHHCVPLPQILVFWWLKILWKSKNKKGVSGTKVPSPAKLTIPSLLLFTSFHSWFWETKKKGQVGTSRQMTTPDLSYCTKHMAHQHKNKRKLEKRIYKKDMHFKILSILPYKALSFIMHMSLIPEEPPIRGNQSLGKPLGHIHRWKYIIKSTFMSL